MGIEVTIMDDSGFAGFVWAAAHTGELYMTSVRNMVDNVLDHLAQNAPYSRVCAPGVATSATMSRLNIIDHGNPTRIQFGTDRISASNFSTFEPQFARLGGHFDSDGFAHLQHCETGMNIPLLEKFADTFGVPVVAGRDKDRPAARLNDGRYVRVYPLVSGRRRASDTFFWRP